MDYRLPLTKNYIITITEASDPISGLLSSRGKAGSCVSTHTREPRTHLQAMLKEGLTQQQIEQVSQKVAQIGHLTHTEERLMAHQVMIV